MIQPGSKVYIRVKEQMEQAEVIEEAKHPVRPSWYVLTPSDGIIRLVLETNISKTINEYTKRWSGNNEE